MTVPTDPARLLVVLPSWVGDAVMATPTLRAIRRAFPGMFIGGLCRPGIDELLAGGELLDEMHVARASGMMGPKFAAGKVRSRRYGTALLLTNSFSTALAVRMAGIPRRIGYDRDARGLLLTHKMEAPRRADGAWAVVPAVEYYWRLAREFLAPESRAPWPAMEGMELPITREQCLAGKAVLERVGLSGVRRLAMLNPGGNNPAKRWPADRFAAVGAELARRGFAVLVSGAPAEAALAADIASGVSRLAPGSRVGDLVGAGVTLGSLKVIVRMCAVMVTNDTGPRHVAAAFGVRLVTLFGPTDHRWTTIPTRFNAPEEIVLADPTLPEGESANDHPERCRIDRIGVDRVVAALDRLGLDGMDGDGSET